MSETAYIPNAGQTCVPFQKNINVPMLPFKPLPRPDPAIPNLKLLPEFVEKGFVVSSQCQHFLSGVEPEMIDWFWANMEKGYYLWAPGSHKRFNWVRSPGEVGFLKSAHVISETLAVGMPPFGGSGIQINRLDLSWFPFTAALKHVIVEGIFNEKGEFFDSTIHMWQAAPGGTNHITAGVANTRCSEPPAFVKAMMAAVKVLSPAEQQAGGNMQDHAEYEASRWPVFLPALHSLWKDHPDPSQNIHCDLRVKKVASGKWEYLAENGPFIL
jgi:hypothetical protein